MSRSPLMFAFMICAMATVAFANEALGVAVTVYNQNFAVVRDRLSLDLKKGVNAVSFSDTTAHVEPDSVILRDPRGNHPMLVLEQKYRADPISQGLLLNLNEGKIVDFVVRSEDGDERVVKGKIIRSGYESPQSSAMRRHMGYSGYDSYADGAGQPIIEVDNQLRFGLPGEPLFPSLGDDTILKPTLQWVIETDRSGKCDAELAYITGGMRWEADYNVITAETGDKIDLTGWVTIDNQCGKTFDNARIRLMAGDVSKLREQEDDRGRMGGLGGLSGGAEPAVTEKSFDEYHLYTLERPTTLRDQQTKQVEFVRAAGVQSKRLYVYDGAQLESQRSGGWNDYEIRERRDYGSESNPKVWVMREFENSNKNNLGIPLPRGVVRFYRRDDGDRLEFVGENLIDHTPKDETVRVYTGNAFDIVGERTQTDFKVDDDDRWLDESFRIKVRNHKKEPVDVRIVEHLYRGPNSEIRANSHDFTKSDARTIEFPVTVEPDGEVTLTYTAHYSW